VRVLVATTTLKPDLREAISKNLIHLCEEVSKDAEVTLLAPGTEPPAVRDLPFLFQSFSCSQSYGSGRTLFSDIKKLCETLKAADLKMYDVLHLHVGFCVEWVLLSRVIRQLSIPVLVTVWQPYLEFREIVTVLKTHNLRLIRGVLPHILFNSFLFRPFYKHAASVYSKIIVSSHVQKKQIESFVDLNQIVQVPNGVVAPAPRGEMPEASVPSRRILYVGHNTPAKGVPCILKALSLVKGRVDFEMTFAFSDRVPLDAFWRTVDQLGLREFITVKGGVDVYDEMSRHDLFLVPYYTSVGVSYYPNVILECLATGLPLISTDIPVVRELLSEVEEKVIVPVNNPEALAERVVALFSNPEQMAQIRSDFRRRYKESYVLESWVRRTAEQYNEVLQKGIHS